MLLRRNDVWHATIADQHAGSDGAFYVTALSFPGLTLKSAQLCEKRAKTERAAVTFDAGVVGR